MVLDVDIAIVVGHGLRLAFAIVVGLSDTKLWEAYTFDYSN